MRIQDVFVALSQMQADGVVDRYAIGGAVGATFYLEPAATLDVDVFVAFRTAPGSLLVSPQPIFDYLKARGGTMEGELAVIALQTGRAKDKRGCFSSSSRARWMVSGSRTFSADMTCRRHGSGSSSSF